MFGVGHGGFETIAYGSSLFMGNIILALMVNSLGMEEYLAKLDLKGDALTDYRNAIGELIAIPPAENVAAGSERLLALIFQTKCPETFSCPSCHPAPYRRLPAHLLNPGGSDPKYGPQPVPHRGSGFPDSGLCISGVQKWELGLRHGGVKLMSKWKKCPSKL